ncbi:MAG: hypothetical protein AAGJ73_10685 [Pseudomonadota bacterium]
MSDAVVSNEIETLTLQFRFLDRQIASEQQKHAPNERRLQSLRMKRLRAKSALRLTRRIGLQRRQSRRNAASHIVGTKR